MTEEQKLPHKLTLSERRVLQVSGVTEVVRFEDTVAVLKTALGTLVVQGKDLQLKNLSQDGGNVAVEGTVTALAYEEPRLSGWKGRLFG
ncbi:MAG: YabP/YqfC family sporulation protein [Faecousia sp.]